MPATLETYKGRSVPKALQSTMETKLLSVDEVNQWRVPPFQRPVRINAKVSAMAADLRANGTMISGVITLGKLLRDNAYYIVDGQHRIEAFRLSGLPEIIADVRVVHFDNMADMADEFVQLNTALVKMRPDDVLRGIAPSHPPLTRILKECPFIGFSNVRKTSSESGPIVSLAAVLRCWYAGNADTPSSSTNGLSVGTLGQNMTDDDAGKVIRFLHIAMAAWGRDPESYRLWGNCNLGLCMWLYVRLVINRERRGSTRVVVLDDAQFKKCLMALSADRNYVDWLQGRLLNDRDRSPGLARIKQIFVRRLTQEGLGKKYNMPMPAWASR